MILKYIIVILHYPRGKGKVPPLKELYEALIESIPAQVRVLAAIRGRWQSYAETEEGAGLASLLIPGKIPYTDTREYSRWIGRPLRDLAALIRGGEEEQSEAMGCAAINAWFNTRSRMAAAGALLYPPESEEGHVFRTLEPEWAGKTVATVGHFHGGEVLRSIKALWVFEKEPQPGDYPEEMEDALLPTADAVVITGMALTNGTLPRLLELCAGKRVALSGPSVPMTPLLFDYGVSDLFGTLAWDIPGCRRAVRDGGHKETWPCMGKAVLRK